MSALSVGTPVCCFRWYLGLKIPFVSSKDLISETKLAGVAVINAERTRFLPGGSLCLPPASTFRSCCSPSVNQEKPSGYPLICWNSTALKKKKVYNIPGEESSSQYGACLLSSMPRCWLPVWRGKKGVRRELHPNIRANY